MSTPETKSAPKGKQTSKSEAESTRDLIKLPNIIGGPPSTGSGLKSTENLLTDSSLTLTIYPCVPEMVTGISLFKLIPAWDKCTSAGGSYVEMLDKVGYTPSDEQIKQKGIIIRAQADSFPSDTFTNEYGEHFLSGMMDVAGAAFGQLTQMTGAPNALLAGDEIVEGIGQMGEGMGGTVGGAISGLAGMLGGGGAKVNDWINSKASTKGKGVSGLVGTMAAGMNKLLAGSRIDFPMIWKSHSYSQTFTCTVRLYNPDPGNDKATRDYILAPLAGLMTLAMPRVTTEDAGFITYDYPFFHKIDCPGLFHIPSGAIQSMTVVKGGDQGLVGFNQRVAIVDVRIDFVNLFSSMINSTDGSDSRPTVKSYLNNLSGKKELEDIYIDEFKVTTPSILKQTKKPTTEYTANTLNTSGENESPAGSRVSSGIQQTYNSGINNNPVLGILKTIT